MQYFVLDPELLTLLKMDLLDDFDPTYRFHLIQKQDWKFQPFLSFELSVLAWHQYMFFYGL